MRQSLPGRRWPAQHADSTPALTDPRLLVPPRNAPPASAAPCSSLPAACTEQCSSSSSSQQLQHTLPHRRCHGRHHHSHTPTALPEAGNLQMQQQKQEQQAQQADPLSREDKLAAVVLQERWSKLAEEKPPRPFSPPPAVVDNWTSGVQEWLDSAMYRPLTVGSTTVHLLGVSHDMSYNCRLLVEVCDSVSPTAIAIETPPRLCAMFKQAGSALQNLILKAAAADFGALVASPGVLDAQEQAFWFAFMQMCLMTFADADADEERLQMLFLAGQLLDCEELTAGYLAEQRGIPLHGLDYEWESQAEEEFYDASDQWSGGLALHQPGQPGFETLMSLLPPPAAAEAKAWLGSCGSEFDGAKLIVMLADGLSPGLFEALPKVVQTKDAVGKLKVSGSSAQSAFKEKVVDGRDVYMADSIRRVAKDMDDGAGGGGVLLAVVGKGHEAGVRRALEQ